MDKTPLMLWPDPLPTRLNLGCGQFPTEGFLNVDMDPLAKADVFLDLEDLSIYKGMPANYFDIIEMNHSLEHMANVFAILRQLHHLLKPGGLLRIYLPHFSRGITHPEHRHGFDVTFPEYFRPSFKGGYAGFPFRLESMRLTYIIRWDLKEALISPWQIKILKALSGFLSWLANLQPYVCSRFWCYLVGGFEQIEFVFKKQE